MYPIVTPRLARRTGSTQPRSRNEPLYPLLLLRQEDTLFHAFVSRGCAAKGRSRALSLSRESLAGALCLRGCIKHRCLSLTRNNGETEMRIDLYDVFLSSRKCIEYISRESDRTCTFQPWSSPNRGKEQGYAWYISYPSVWPRSYFLNMHGLKQTRFENSKILVIKCWCRIL